MTWIKFHCRQWFLGSTRWELTTEERAVWVDLLARAGLNDPPGQVDFYSLEQLAHQFTISVELLQNCINLFEKCRKIMLNENCIKILNWRKYQSGYMVKKARRKRARKPPGDDITFLTKNEKSNIRISSQNRGEERRSEKIRKEETRTELFAENEAFSAPSRPEILKDLWNEICTNLPRVISLSKRRIQQCKVRLKERPLAEWEEIFRIINRTPFLCGENDRGWQASFDWLIANQDNAIKILEGKYEKAKVVPKSWRGLKQWIEEEGMEEEENE